MSMKNISNTSFGIVPFHNKTPSGPPAISIANLTNHVKSPEDLLDTFIFNNIQYNWGPDPENINNPFQIKWPDYIFKYKMGICVDFAIFAHFVFQKLNIKHAIAFTAFVDEVDDKVSQLGHAYMIFREYGEYKIWNYFHGGIGDINGYFRNYQETIDKCGPYFDVLYKSEVLMPGSIESHHPRACVSTYLEDGKDLEFIDKASEDKDDKNISQAELFMRSFKIQKLMIEANALKTKLKAQNGINYNSNFITRINPAKSIKFIAPKLNKNALKQFLAKFNDNTMF